MLDSAILETIVGLMLIYLVLSLVVTALNEWVAQVCNLRGGTLHAGIRNLLGGELTTRLYEHPLIGGLTSKSGEASFFRGQANLPSYIPAHLFATALFDVIDPHHPGSVKRDVATLRGAISEPPPQLTPPQLLEFERARKTLLPLLASADDDCAQAQRNIEHWFKQANRRFTGQYVRQIRMVTILFAVIMALLMNADTLKLADYLSTNGEMRQLMVQHALSGMATSPAGSPEWLALNQELERGFQDKLALPFSWEEEDLQYFPDIAGSASASSGTESATDASSSLSSFGWGFRKVLGLALTAAAISLGAPFWFDTLNRFVNIRATGPTPEEPDSLDAKTEATA